MRNGIAGRVIKALNACISKNDACIATNATLVITPSGGFPADVTNEDGSTAPATSVALDAVIDVAETTGGRRKT